MPNKSTQRLLVDIPKELHTRIRLEAALRHTTQKQVVLDMITTAFESLDSKTASVAQEGSQL